MLCALLVLALAAKSTATWEVSGNVASEIRAEPDGGSTSTVPMRTIVEPDGSTTYVPADVG